jgi:hypothetical protein
MNDRLDVIRRQLYNAIFQQTEQDISSIRNELRETRNDLFEILEIINQKYLNGHGKIEAYPLLRKTKGKRVKFFAYENLNSANKDELVEILDIHWEHSSEVNWENYLGFVISRTVILISRHQPFQPGKWSDIFAEIYLDDDWQNGIEKTIISLLELGLCQAEK